MLRHAVASATTDWDGRYELYPLRAGPHTVVVGKMSYARDQLSGKAGVAAQGPNDPELQRQLAGFYCWGSAADTDEVARWTITGTLQAGSITITYPDGKTYTME